MVRKLDLVFGLEKNLYANSLFLLIHNTNASLSSLVTFRFRYFLKRDFKMYLYSIKRRLFFFFLNKMRINCFVLDKLWHCIVASRNFVIMSSNIFVVLKELYKLVELLFVYNFSLVGFIYNSRLYSLNFFFSLAQRQLSVFWFFFSIIKIYLVFILQFLVILSKLIFNRIFYFIL